MIGRSFEFEVTVDKSKALSKVRENRIQHARLVEEARAGYREKAKIALKEKLAQLLAGKTVSLSFHLPQPQAFTREYDMAIAMLEAHEEAVVVLKPDEFRRLMMDEWDWMSSFTAINAAYSDGTRAWGLEKGVEVEGAGLSR